jgi:hypothetical protein
MICLLLGFGAAHAKADRRQRRPVNTACISDLQEQSLVRLFEWRAIEHNNAVGSFSWPDSSSAESKVGNRKLLCGTPPGSLEQPTCPNFPTELNLWRHQLDAVILRVDGREHHDHLAALVNDFRDSRSHQFLTRRGNVRTWSVEFWQWRLYLAL